VVWPLFAAGVLLGMLLTPAGTMLGVVHDRSVVLRVVGFGGPPLVGLVLFVRRRTRSVGAGVLLAFAVFWVAVIPLAAALFGG